MDLAPALPTAFAEDLPTKRRKDSPPAADASDPMTVWRQAARRSFAIVVLFSVVVNLLMLTLPLYLFQISDRVLTSRSLDTLLDALHRGPRLHRRALADRYPRRQVLGRPVDANGSDARRAGPGEHRQQCAGRRAAATSSRSAACSRCGASSRAPSMLLLIDGPLAPLYFAVDLSHSSPSRLRSPCAGGVLLFSSRCSTRRATAEPLSQSGAAGIEGRRGGGIPGAETRRSSTRWGC